MFYLNVRFISPPSCRKAWLSLSSAQQRAIYGNPNVCVYLIIDTCLVRTLTNEVVAVTMNLLENRVSIFKSIKRYFYETLLYNWHTVELPVADHWEVHIFSGWCLKSDVDYHNWQYLQFDYVNIYKEMICWLWSLYCNFVCPSKQ